MKNYLIICAVFLFSTGLKAQERNSVSLNLYGGYAFQDKVKLDNNFHAIVNPAFEYGAGIEFFPQRTNSFELKWLGMSTDLPLYGPTGTQLNPDPRGSINYILADGKGYFGEGDKAKFFAGAGLGVGIISMKAGNSSTKFAWDAELGVKVKTSATMSVNLRAYVQSIVATVGSDMYLGYWGVYAVPDYASIFQFGLGGVICFNFKKK